MKIIVYNRQFTNVCVFKFGTVKFHDLLLGENVCPIETLLLNFHKLVSLFAKLLLLGSIATGGLLSE